MILYLNIYENDVFVGSLMVYVRPRTHRLTSKQGEPLQY